MASVGKAVLLQDGQTAVLVTDFDPATMDVVIVAKDARRVWIDRCSDGMWLHTLPPDACHERGWVSCGMFSIDDIVLEDMEHNDCIEFVAVETRRPVKTPDSLFWDPRDDNQLPHGCTLEVVAAPVPGLAVSHA